MAHGAVMADGLPAVAHVISVVTAEAATEIEMADIVRIGLPADLHQGKDVLRKLVLHSNNNLFHERDLMVEQVRVAMSIELRNSGSNPFSCCGGRQVRAA